MNHNPLKSVLIDGLLYDKQLSTKISLEYFQIYCGVWRVAVSDLRFSFLETIDKDTCFEIRSNIVQSLVISERGGLKKEGVCLQTFQCLKKNPSIVFHFPNLQWFIISDPDECISINISKWPSETSNVPKKIKISIRLLFERIV